MLGVFFIVKNKIILIYLYRKKNPFFTATKRAICIFLLHIIVNLTDKVRIK